jgi:ATP-dependent RNA helicase MSS116
VKQGGHLGCQGGGSNKQVEQTHIIVPNDTQLATGTIDVLLTLIDQDPDLKLVVFFPTTKMVAFYAAIFNEGLGIDDLEIHSHKLQSYRTKASDKFCQAISNR